MNLSGNDPDVFWATDDPNADPPAILFRPLVSHHSPIDLRWFANWQRAATFTLDMELDWSEPALMIEFVFGIGFQVGFVLVVSK